VIFARSSRSLVLVIASGAAVAVTFMVAAVFVAIAHGFELVTIALAMGAVLGLAMAGTGAWQLWAWPPRRLAFFRDRMVVVEGNVEQHAAWERVETATLAGPMQWLDGSWPEVRISDRLTVYLKRGKTLSLRPADFGLAPAGCRDLVLMLRDDRQLRGRLPEFDSSLDLSDRPVVTGELITPRL
jgi:hypothetical protein